MNEVPFYLDARSANPLPSDAIQTVQPKPARVAIAQILGIAKNAVAEAEQTAAQAGVDVKQFVKDNKWPLLAAGALGTWLIFGPSK